MCASPRESGPVWSVPRTSCGFAVSVWWFLYIYSSAGAIAWAFKDARSVLAAAWLTHYVYRSFIYPVRQPASFAFLCWQALRAPFSRL